jgi:lipopolysaccharide biosynthesis protein
VKKQLRKTLSQSKWALWVPLARLVGRIRRRRQIVSIWPEGEITLGPRVAVFMHFDGHGQVRTQVQRYLEELRRNGRSIVFVSNSETPAPTAMAVAQRLCDAVIMRRNIGYDFGAWADALDALGLPRAGTEEIIFANDSVLGPLLPLGDILRRLDYAHADVWGLTESWQQQHHLQSYFLAFGPAALAAPAFQKFWASVRPVPLKIFIVRAYEVGITQAMRKGGLRCEALWPYHELLRKAVNEGLGPLAEAEATELGRNDPLTTRCM